MSSKGFIGCESCDRGWRYATPQYVESRFPFPPHATAEQIATTYRLREEYREFVLPCAECRPEAFRRWANGCWEPGHASGRCDLCQEAGAGR